MVYGQQVVTANLATQAASVLWLCLRLPFLFFFILLLLLFSSALHDKNMIDHNKNESKHRLNVPFQLTCVPHAHLPKGSVPPSPCWPGTYAMVKLREAQAEKHNIFNLHFLSNLLLCVLSFKFCLSFFVI